MSSQEQEQKQVENKVVLPNWAAFLLLIVFIVVVGFILYLQFFRYSLVGHAINKGDLTSSAMLLSPEISAGITRVITGF